MRGVLLLFALILSNVINSGESKKKPKPEKTKDTDISKLPLDHVDADSVAGVSLKNVDTLGCGQKFDFSSGASIVIQTKNYPRNYPGSSWAGGTATLATATGTSASPPRPSSRCSATVST